MKCVVDIEADSLDPTVIWCIVCKCIDTGTLYKFYGALLYDFVQFSRTVDGWIAHNGIGYDIPVLNRLLGTDIKISQVEDTAVMSRLFNPTRSGGHSLENLGEYLNCPKIEFNDFSRFTTEMLDYCVQDVETTYKVYNFLLREGDGFSDRCIRLEHAVQHILEQQKANGFYLDQDKAMQIRAECLDEMGKIEFEVEKHFRPRPKLIRTVTPKYRKDGTMSVVGLKQIDNPLETVAGEFSLIQYIPFNLSSPSQVTQRMEEYGWRPVVFNKPTENMKKAGMKRGSPKICEENIATLPDTAPEIAKSIGTYLMCKNRAGLVEQWFNALKEDGKVHGTVFSVGANTHRMSHIDPNMANIPSVAFNDNGEPVLGLAGRFGHECRSCFTLEDIVNYRLVGVDAKAIQLRVFAHYVNDAVFTDAMVNGDIHEFNREALGLGTVTGGRAIAKTFIYAFLLGGGDAKLGYIVGGTARDGANMRAKFMDSIAGVAALKEANKEDANRGYFIGLDGRRLPIKSAHFALSSYLQGGEAVIMKLAYINWYNRVRRLKLDARPVAIVHDEYQIEAHRDVAETVGQIVVEAIQGTTKTLDLNCPMDGEAAIGLTWAGTH